MPVRLFTVNEANTLLATLDEVLERAQGILKEMRDARDQLVDLRIVWGDQVESSSCPDQAEYAKFKAAFQDAEARLAAAMAEAQAMGCEVKDVEQGLVDFYASRGEEVVYLCWRKGEPRIRFWHRLSDGFGGRQPLDGP